MLEINIGHIIRILMIFFVAGIITLFVVDFGAVIDIFTAFSDLLGAILDPIKSILK